MDLLFPTPRFGYLTPDVGWNRIDADQAQLSPLRREPAIQKFIDLKDSLVTRNGAMAPFLEKLLGVQPIQVTPEHLRGLIRDRKMNTGAIGALAVFIGAKEDEDLVQKGVEYLTVYCQGVEAFLVSLEDHIEDLGWEPEAATGAVASLLERLEAVQRDLEDLPPLESTHSDARRIEEGLGKLKEQAATVRERLLRFQNEPEETAAAFEAFEQVRKMTVDFFKLREKWGATPAIGETYGELRFGYRNEPYSLEEVKAAVAAVPAAIHERVALLRDLRDQAKTLSKTVDAFSPRMAEFRISERKEALKAGVNGFIEVIRTELEGLASFVLAPHLAGLEERMELPPAIDAPSPMKAFSWGRGQLSDIKDACPAALHYYFHRVDAGERLRLAMIPEVTLFGRDQTALTWMTDKIPPEEMGKHSFSRIKIYLMFLTLTYVDPAVFKRDDIEVIRDTDDYYSSFKNWSAHPLDVSAITAFLKCRERWLQRMFLSPKIARDAAQYMTKMARVVGSGHIDWLGEAVRNYVRKNRLRLSPEYNGHTFAAGINLFDLMLYLNAVFSDALAAMDFSLALNLQKVMGLVSFDLVWPKILEKTPDFEVPTLVRAKRRILAEGLGVASPDTWKDLWENAFCLQTPTRTYFALPNEEGNKIRDAVSKYRKQERRKEGSFTDMVTGETVALEKAGIGYAVRTWTEIPPAQRAGLWYDGFREKMLLLGDKPSYVLDIALALLKAKSKAPWAWRHFLCLVHQTDGDADRLRQVLAEWVIAHEPFLIHDAAMKGILSRLDHAAANTAAHP